MTYQLQETLLKVDNVSLNFGDKKVLRDINLEIKDITSTTTCLGQVTTLLGRSGVGKTQLMKIIAGLLKPTTGQVLIGKEQVPVTPGLVGMVLQTYPLLEHRTLLDNLKLVCKDKDKINHYLEDFDVYEHKSKYPSQLSGGQRQRVAIIQQLLSSGNFILLDEPFSGLDPVATEKLCININKIANQDELNTVIISSHILEPSIAISDHIWIVGHDYISKEEIEVANLPLYKTVDAVLNGKTKIEGATLLYNEDLAAQGLAWNPDIKKEIKFTQMIEHIRELFQKI